MSNKHAIRLSYRYGDLAQFIDLLKDETDVLVLYEHEDGNRPHVHIYTEGLKLSVLTCKNRLAKYLGFRPAKEDWSFKTADDRKFITYMSKGTLQPKYCKGIDGAELEGLRSQWIERRQPNTEKKAETPTSYDMARELSVWIKSRVKYVDGYYDTPEDWWIVDECINIHNRSRKTYTDFSLLRIVQTAWGMLDSPRVMKDKLIKNVCSRLYPQNQI